ncbi:MAG: chitinase [Lachnospiraceae bacterium]|nr:chitinase [Lachnospiraceae bacterium]
MEHHPSGKKKKKKRGRKRRDTGRLKLILGMTLFILLVIGGLVGYFLYKRYSYGTERADLTNWFGEYDSTEYPVILNDEETEIVLKRIDGHLYMPLTLLHEMISDRYYHGVEDGIFVYTTPTAILTSQVGSNTVTSTEGGATEMPYVISRLEQDTLYVAVEYVRQYHNITLETFDAPNRVRMYTGTLQKETALVTEETQLRIAGGIKSPIITDLAEGDRVVIVDASLGDWIKVRTPDAFTGYVEQKRLSETESFTYGSDAIQEPVYSNISRPFKICLGWHQIAGVGGNDTLQEVIAPARGMNVISPTWIRLSDDFGGIESFGTTDYVNAAHAAGLEVWALVSNFENPEVNTQAVVSHAASRKALTDNVIAEIKRLGCEGINVDFEGVASEAGKDYVQWLRELSIACRREQIVLSIDNYVPYGFNDYYNRREQGIIADYVIIMGYDEHYGGSPEAGSVASVDFVRYGIEETCKQVPAEKVINAVPWYTRVWTTKSDGSVSSFATGMNGAKEAAAERGIEFTWDAATGQYYGARTYDNGDKVEIWLEDRESLTEKISVMRANHIAGVAGWRLGLENAEAWDVISEYVNGY